VNTDKGRAYTSLARHSALVKRCASAGPRFTWPCHRPGELGGEPRAARDSLTAQTRPAPIFAAKHPGPRGETLRSTRGQQVVVLKNTGRKHGTRLGGRGRDGSTQLARQPCPKSDNQLTVFTPHSDCHDEMSARYDHVVRERSTQNKTLCGVTLGSWLRQPGAEPIFRDPVIITFGSK
jgi:hypothetical protein